jgi:hypothetical protein
MTAPLTVLLLCQMMHDTGSVAIDGSFQLCPNIDSAIATPSATLIGVYDVLDVIASASQPEGHPLTYAWTATSGSFDDPTTATRQRARELQPRHRLPGPLEPGARRPARPDRPARRRAAARRERPARAPHAPARGLIRNSIHRLAAGAGFDATEKVVPGTRGVGGRRNSRREPAAIECHGWRLPAALVSQARSRLHDRVGRETRRQQLTGRLLSLLTRFAAVG